MSPVIKLGGKKTATRSQSAKPRSAKASPSRGRTKAAVTTSDGRVRRPTTTDQNVINRHIKILERVGEEREEAWEAHKDAVQAVYEATRAAMEAGVPTGIITDSANITRQWLYNMDKHENRDQDAKPARTRQRQATKPKATGQGRRATAKTAGKRKVIRTR